MDRFGSVLVTLAHEGKETKMKNRRSYCKKTRCIYYDHKHYENNCSASSRKHKQRVCSLYKKRKEEVRK